MTIAELAASGLPAILVPFPGAAANHQFKNAKTLADSKAALLVEDNDNLRINLAGAINKLKTGRNQRVQMRNNLKQFYTPDVIKKIADEIQKLL